MDSDSVTKCLAKDMMPIYTVEKSAFQQLLKDFDPKYQFPSRKYFSQQAIPKLAIQRNQGDNFTTIGVSRILFCHIRYVVKQHHGPLHVIYCAFY